jgi:hypothetical protein
MKLPLAFEISVARQVVTSYEPEDKMSQTSLHRHRPHTRWTRDVKMQDSERENVVDFGVVRPAMRLKPIGRGNIMSTHTSQNGRRIYLAQNDRTPLLRAAPHLIRPHLSLFDAQAHVWYHR